MKWTYCMALSVFLTSAAAAQKPPIPLTYVQDVLQARLVAVVSYSGSEPTADLQENQRARLDVETAMVKWGRYQVTGDTTIADLIIVVRRGRAGGATIGNDKTSNPNVILYPNDSGTTIHLGHGQNPPLSRTAPPPQAGPRLGTETGSADDLLEVYLGGTPRVDDASRKATQYPLDEPPIWFYTATDALKPPKVEAVTRFREAVEAAAKKKP